VASGFNRIKAPEPRIYGRFISSAARVLPTSQPREPSPPGPVLGSASLTGSGGLGRMQIGSSRRHRRQLPDEARVGIQVVRALLLLTFFPVDWTVMKLLSNPPSAIVLVIALLGTACGGDSSSSPTSPSTQPAAPFSQTDLRVGTGTEAVAGRPIRVSYAGWLYDPGQSEGKGREFDRNTIGFRLGAREVIPGWDQGVVGMRVGGQRRLVIPPELAYGSTGREPAIPPNATLVFDVELLEVQ